jgi:hypothetical protein
MKVKFFRIFGIALTLAMVASLFAIAPLSAHAPNNIDFVIPLDIASMVRSTYTLTNEWVGNEYEATLPYGAGSITKTLNGTTYKFIYAGLTQTYQLIPTGTFGAGIGVLHFDVIDDYVAKQHIVDGYWVFTFFDDPENDNWEGTLTCSRVVTRPILSWKNDNPENWEVISAAASDPASIIDWTFASGTGDFENFYFSTIAPGAADQGAVFGTGSFLCNGSQTFDLTPVDGLSGSGFATINSSSGRNNVELTVSLKGAATNTTYEVWLESNGSPVFGPVGTFTTNKQGNGNFHINMSLNPGIYNLGMDVTAGGEDRYLTSNVYGPPMYMAFK